MTQDFESFRQLEHTSWEEVAGLYGSVWASLTTQFIEPLLNALEIRQGLDVLDVACGPGYVAQAVRNLGAIAAGIDFSTEMIRIARVKHPGIEFQVGDAEELSFPDESFDRVIVNFGILHLANPDKAFAEARRVLRPGGKFGFTVWAKPEENPGAKIVEDAIDAHADLSVKLPEGPQYFLFSDPIECRRILTQSGFSGDSMRFMTHTVKWQVPTKSFLFEAERDAGVRTAALLARQTPERLKKIQAQIESGMERFKIPGGYGIPMSAHIITLERNS